MNSQMIIPLVSLILGLFFGLAVHFIHRKMMDDKKKNAAEKEADRILNRARSKANKLEKEGKRKAKDFETRAKRNVEDEIKKEKNKLISQQNSFKDKERKLDKNYSRKMQEFDQKLQKLESKEEHLAVIEKRTKQMKVEAEKEVLALKDRLLNIANMSETEAREELKRALEDGVRAEMAPELNRIENEAKGEAQQKAKRILSVAISRYASEVSTERTVSLMALTSDEMKGKLIGREGRNIRALEAACGVDLIIDETPESVVISSFDPVRREVAKKTIERLMEDGRVHPARIEEVAGKVKEDILNSIKLVGEQTCFDLDVHGVNGALQNLVGLLQFRQAEAQNLLKHSLDVAHISGILAAELGVNVKAAKRAGLLHGIGRAIDHSVEGSYSKVGADFARKHGEREAVVSAIRCHDGKTEAKSVIDHIVQAAFNFALARPGAKRSMIENFIRRLSDLESVANSFDGVVKSYALQAGKEIRVMVDGGKVTDDQAQMLSRDIARKVEKELNYPGQVKIAVLREMRVVEHAR